MLYPKLHKNEVLSSNSTSGLGEVISPQMTMAIGLCLLAGASYIDLTSAYGASESSVFAARNLFVDAVNSCEELKIVSLIVKKKYINCKMDFKQRVPMVL